jgi:hypothetical protein
MATDDEVPPRPKRHALTDDQFRAMLKRAAESRARKGPRRAEIWEAYTRALFSMPDPKLGSPE